MTDDELFDLLVQTFAPAPLEPPPAGVFALRRAVGASSPPLLASWRRRLAAAAAVFTLVLSGSATAFALSGAPLPRPLRVAAHGVGLPVDSVAVADARTAAERLKDALARHDPVQVEEAARQLRARLAHLERGENPEIGQQSAKLLQEANEAGEQGPQPQNSTGPTATPPSPSAGTSGGSSGGSGDLPTPGNTENGGQHSNDTPTSIADSDQSGHAN